MRDENCTNGLHRLLIMVVVALMMAFVAACGDDDAACADGEIEIDGEGCLPLCDSDADCSGNATCEATSGGDQVCVPGDEPDPECTDDTDCGDGEICDGGECVDDSDGPECTDDTDCGTDEICDDGECVDDSGEPECTDNSECASGFECVNEECVPESTEPECTEDNDCASGLICDTANEVCVECLDDSDCGEGESCSNNQCEADLGFTTEELCAAFCDAVMVCPNTEACSVPGLEDYNEEEAGMLRDICIHGDFQRGIDSCVLDYDSDPEFRETVDFFAVTDFDDPEGPPRTDAVNTCEDFDWLHCGGWGLAPYCNYCDAPENIGGSCDADDDCPSGSLDSGICIDTANMGLSPCEPGEGDCSGDDECLEVFDPDTGDSFHVCGESCTPPGEDGVCSEEDYFCFTRGDASDTDAGICAHESLGDDSIVDGMCVALVCWIPDGAEAGDVNIDGHSCGADGACVAAPVYQDGSLGGLCMQACDSNSECETGRACQVSGALYESSGASELDDDDVPSPVGMARVCDAPCEEDAHCGEGDFHCNADGICEQPTADVDCEALGGTPHDVDGTEYCGLD